MGKTRPPYPPEFRREALNLMRSGARTPRQLAAELGCTEQTLRNWLRQDETDRGERTDLLTTDERARLRELERENRVLRGRRPCRGAPGAVAKQLHPGHRPDLVAYLAGGGDTHYPNGRQGRRRCDAGRRGCRGHRVPAQRAGHRATRSCMSNRSLHQW